jgi:hypothetical protein
MPRRAAGVSQCRGAKPKRIPINALAGRVMQLKRSKID